MRRYGWHRSLPDQRNLKADLSGVRSRKRSDLRPVMPDPYDQLDLGSCTANAVAACIEHYFDVKGAGFGTPSRLWIYYRERELEGTVGWDSGAYGHDGFKVARSAGVPPETVWPYDIAKFASRPSRAAYDEAPGHRIVEYRQVAQSASHIKRALAYGQPIAFGFTVYDSFESSEVERTGVVPMPGKDEGVLGGHEVVIVGHDEPERRFTVRNSWGKEWGDKGHCYMPYEYVLSPDLADDFRTVRQFA